MSLISKINLILVCCYTLCLPISPPDDMEFPKHKELRRLNSPELGIGLFVYTSAYSWLEPELSRFPASWLPAHANIQSQTTETELKVKKLKKKTLVCATFDNLNIWEQISPNKEQTTRRVTLFNILANSFNIWLNRGHPDCPYLLPHSASGDL